MIEGIIDEENPKVITLYKGDVVKILPINNRKVLEIWDGEGNYLKVRVTFRVTKVMEE